MPNELEVLFVKAMVRFLKQQVRVLNPDAAESAEVAIQCLEAAFEIHSESEAGGDGGGGGGGGGGGAAEGTGTAGDPASDEGAVGGPATGNPIEEINLFELFQTAVVNVTPARKEQAEQVKNEGNKLMRECKYGEALLLYSRAIALDATNPVIYCNRAAAHIRLSQYEKALVDCRMSLLYNPNYSKAHGRMGIALSNLNRYEEARQAYRRAIELEPDNQDFQNNLRVCEEQLQRDQGPTNLRQQFIQNMAVDNPDLRNLISDMINDPMISAASRQLVVQMLNEYPEFVTGFRQQLINFASSVGDSGSGESPVPNVGGGGGGTGGGGGGAGTGTGGQPSAGHQQLAMDAFREIEMRLNNNFRNLQRTQTPQQQQQQQQQQQNSGGNGDTGTGTQENVQQTDSESRTQKSDNNVQHPKRD